MGWLKRANTEKIGYYISVDPKIYYEWEFNGQVPENTKVYWGNLDRIRKINNAVLGIRCSENEINKKGENLFLSRSIPVKNLYFISGSAKDKTDLLNDYKNDKQYFKQKIESFKESMLSRRYYIDTSHEKPLLYVLAKVENDTITINNYGPWAEIVSCAEKTQSILNNKTKIKDFKALDLTDLHKLTQNMIQSNYNIPFDFNKISSILQTSNINPKNEFQISWKDLILRLEKEARKLNQKIKEFEELGWTKSACKCLRDKY